MAAVLTKPKQSIAIEVIDFQDNSFGIKLEAIVSKLKESLDKKVYKTVTDLENSSELSELAGLIFARLGISVKFVTNNALAAILPFYSNKHHIFIDKFFRGNFSIEDQDKLLKDANNKKGTVDLKHAKVGGIFSEYKHNLYMNFNDLFYVINLNPTEVTAIMLHELGHAFYACEYSDRIESINQVLANVAKELNPKKKEKDLTYIFKELKTINDKITEEDVDIIVNGNRVIAGYKWFKAIIDSDKINIASQMNNDKYDQSSFEQLADGFASRFSYGKSLIIALDKIHSKHGSAATSTSLYVISQMLETAYLILMIVAPLVLISSSFPLAVMLGVLNIFTFYTLGDSGKDLTYDALKDRYKRVRNEYISFIKDAGLPDNEIKDALQAIYAIDAVMNDTRKYISIINKISNFIFPSNRKARNAIEEQQLLESMANNELFLKAAELKTI